MRENDYYSRSQKLLQVCVEDKVQLLRLSAPLLSLVPMVPKEKRYAIVKRWLMLWHRSGGHGLRHVCAALDETLLLSLNPLEMIYLSEEVLFGLRSVHEQSRTDYLEALVQIIPALHPINQRDMMFELYRVAALAPALILNALTRLIYDAKQPLRSQMVFYFGQILGLTPEKQNYKFILNLLASVTSALPEAERVNLVERVAPYLYHSQNELAQSIIEYLGVVLNLLPTNERQNYAQVLIEFAHDPLLKHSVQTALAKSLPFLNHESLVYKQVSNLQDYDYTNDSLKLEHLTLSD